MKQQPIADKLRPTCIEEIYGQTHLLGPGKPLARAIEQQRAHPMILWGPPGSGKTTLARLFSESLGYDFIALSAVFSGVKDIRAAVSSLNSNKSTILFIDEIHRFNKSQQDALLPYVESGEVVFIGATTENPSFEVNRALMSRVRLYCLKPLSPTELGACLSRASLILNRAIAPEAAHLLIAQADGDARRLLMALEVSLEMQTGEDLLALSTVKDALGESWRQFDKGGDIFYEMISALHKSIRGSNPDAALYWFARLLDAGCQPTVIGRRLIRMASEDIGNADPRALTIAIEACSAYDRLGSPEGELALGQAVLFLAVSAKSNASYKALNAALQDAKRGTYPVPEHLRNASTGLMKSLGYGKGYQYDHDHPQGHHPDQQYFPVELGEQLYYDPPKRGLEEKIGLKLAQLRCKTPKEA